MLGHMIGQVKPKTASAERRFADRTTSADLNSLHVLSRRGLWGMLMFMSLSAAALYLSQAGIFALLPVEVTELIGAAPPPVALHAALAVSWLSAFVLIIGRRDEDGKPAYSWYNVGLPTACYPLYIFSDTASVYFPAVFAAGLLLLLIEHFTVLRYTRRLIREETARLK